MSMRGKHRGLETNLSEIIFSNLSEIKFSNSEIKFSNPLSPPG
jgi:hypothetical protein